VASDEERVRRCIPFAFGLKKNAAEIAQVIYRLVVRVICKDWYEENFNVKDPAELEKFENEELSN